VLPLTGPAFAVTPGTITFSGSHRLALSGPSFGITPGDMSFSTSGGGGDAESPVILPNQQVSDRALQASLATLVFRTSDTAPTRTAKLELLRTGVRGKTLALSITGLPDADPSVPLLRIELLDATEIGDVVASAGIAATGSPALRFKKDGLANGTVTFAGAVGAAVGIDDYPAGSLLEIYPPAVADATLDDVSISIRVTIG
jgi:hypothetical protein